MLMKLLLFIGVLGALEIVVLIQLGHWLGFWWTLGLLLAAGLVGTWLVRLEGFRVLNQIRDELQARRAPTDQMLDVVLILLAAGCLILPGVVSDLIGLVLLAPPLRRWIKPALRKRFRWAGPDSRWRFTQRRPSGEIIDIEPVAPEDDASRPTR